MLVANIRSDLPLNKSPSRICTAKNREKYTHLWYLDVCSFEITDRAGPLRIYSSTLIKNANEKSKLDKTLSRFGQYPAFKLGFGRACTRRGSGAEEAWEGYPGAVGARVVYLELP